MTNSVLTAARVAKNDEFYTDLNDVGREMFAYIDYDPSLFRGRTVLLPCDDPEWSAFTSFFVQKFDELGLFKLISTSYNPGGRGKVFTVKRDLRRKQTRIDDLEWSYLDGDGDFRSAEVTALRDESDFVITNPPFSLFREFLAWIREGGQQFSLIGNKNAITYKDVFPLLQAGEMWSGFTPWSGGMWFRVPEQSETWDDIRNNEKSRNVAAMWFTNIEFGKRHRRREYHSQEQAYRTFCGPKQAPTMFKRYDNYDAIEVPISRAIPDEYDGVMGVPISYLENHCPEQFEIVGLSASGIAPEALKLPHHKTHHNPWINGQEIYRRIFIRAIR